MQAHGLARLRQARIRAIRMWRQRGMVASQLHDSSGSRVTSWKRPGRELLRTSTVDGCAGGAVKFFTSTAPICWPGPGELLPSAGPFLCLQVLSHGLDYK